MSKLEEITVENVKGMSSKTIILDLNPNKPSILVAPNGFGKSSIACGFNSMNRNKIDLSEANHYQKDLANKPTIVIKHDGTTYSATDSTNSISGTFDIAVINTQVIAKATKRNMGRFTTATASLEVSSVVLIDRVPQQVKVPYKFSDMKRSFGLNGKVLLNAGPLIEDLNFWSLVEEHQIDFSAFGKVRTYKNLIQPIVDEINALSGTADQVKSSALASTLPKLQAISPLTQLAELIIAHTGYDEFDSYLLAWQVATISLETGFKDAFNYKIYLREKSFFDDLLSSADSTIHGIRTSEESVSGGSKRLVVKFPSADYMSNGQRDILSFITQMHRSMKRLRKDYCIIIIDEIFDYLDDANLVAFQFYITQMIDEFKSQGRNIYPLLLTHLDPAYFRHFCFNKHRLQVRYLNRNPSVSSSVFLNLVKKRDHPSIQAGVDQHHFHYYPTEIDLETQFQSLSLRKAWGKSHSFYNIVHGEAFNYLNGNAFDPIATIFSVRIKIEELVYAMVPAGSKAGFLAEHGTANKLDYCERLGLNIPESYYLLGLIYNVNLHWINGRDYETPLRSKLDNFVIRNMIAELYI